MRRAVFVALLVSLAVGISLALPKLRDGNPTTEAKKAVTKPDFKMTASYIEACSCDQFCPCYFNTFAKAHNGVHFCKFNNVLRVDKGYYKDTDLAGVKVWLSGDLGHEWGQGKADWLVFTFDPSVTEAQKAAMLDILPKLYAISAKGEYLPLQWKPLGVDAVPITWQVEKNVAHARLGNGKGEVILERIANNNQNPAKEVVIQNLKYWAAQSNTGFRMWKNKRHYYEGHGQKIDFSGTNGFLITIDFEGSASKPASN